MPKELVDRKTIDFVLYALCQITILLLAVIMLIYLHQIYPPNGYLPPMIYLIGVALAANVSTTLRHYRQSSREYKRIIEQLR
jgi:predicted membrane channel-forming protein YqfA (hemolysin III family)